MSRTDISGNVVHTTPLVTIDYLRKLVNDALNKQLHETSCYFAERLLRLPGRETSDDILFARCYYQAGEPRRCLAVLEQKGLLSAEALNELHEVLRPFNIPINNNINSKSSSSPAILLSKTMIDHLNAVHLASKCLLAVDEVDDCLALLEPIVFIENDDIAASAVAHIKDIAPQTVDGINILSGIYCTAGRCLDQLENRPQALRAFLSSVRIDITCIETVEYVKSHGLLTSEERRNWLEEVNRVAGQVRQWLVPYYRFLLEEQVVPTSSDGQISVCQVCYTECPVIASASVCNCCGHDRQDRLSDTSSNYDRVAGRLSLESMIEDEDD